MIPYQSIKVGVLTLLWTIAFALGVGGTAWDDVPLLFWALMSGIIAAVMTAWVIAECTVRQERLRVEDIIAGLVAQARENARQQAESDLPRVH